MSECVCCGATVPEGRQICLVCEKNLKLLKELRKERKNMRRIDKLRAMSVEDIAKMMYYSNCCDDYCKSDCGIDCKELTDHDCLVCVVKWLEEEGE